MSSPVAPLLFLKLTLAPALVGAAGLAGRRFGPRVGGWLIGFPVVAGPVLWFYAREQGSAFAARAAAGTALGVVSLCGFILAYAWSSRRLGWLPSVLIGWGAFAALTLALTTAPAVAASPWPVTLLAALAALTLTLRALPRASGPLVVTRPRHDLLWRMLSAALLVLTLTAVASVLGPSLSGLVTPFPVATSILVVFAHREAGHQGVLASYAGYIPSLYSFVAFCGSLSFALTRWPAAGAMAFALAVSVASQMVVLRTVTGRRVRGE